MPECAYNEKKKKSNIIEKDINLEAGKLEGSGNWLRKQRIK